MEIATMVLLTFMGFIIGVLYGRRQTNLRFAFIKPPSEVLKDGEKGIGNEAEFVSECQEFIYVAKKRPDVYHSDACSYVTGPYAFWKLRKCRKCSEDAKKKF